MHLVWRFSKAQIQLLEELSILLFQPAIYHADNVLPLKLPLCMGRSGPTSNSWFLGPTRFHIPDSIGSALLHRAKLWQNDRLTDRQTDQAATSVTIGHLHSSELRAMRPNSKLCNIVVTDGRLLTSRTISMKFIIFIYISLWTSWTPLYICTNAVNQAVCLQVFQWQKKYR